MPLRYVFVPPFLGEFAKLQKATLRFVVPVRPYGTARLPLNGCSWNLKIHYFSKAMDKIQVSLKHDKNKRLLYVKNYVKVKVNQSLYRRGQAGSFPVG